MKLFQHNITHFLPLYPFFPTTNPHVFGRGLLLESRYIMLLFFLLGIPRHLLVEVYSQALLRESNESSKKCIHRRS
jgi:hypothetical protein